MSTLLEAVLKRLTHPLAFWTAVIIFALFAAEPVWVWRENWIATQRLQAAEHRAALEALERDRETSGADNGS